MFGNCHRRRILASLYVRYVKALEIVLKNRMFCLFILYMNPAVKSHYKILGGNERILLLPPLDTDEMHNLMARCYMVMTDSGGLQEERLLLANRCLY